MLFRILVLISLYFCQTSLVADPLIGRELISCEAKGRFVESCFVTPSTLLDRMATESDFYVSYTLTCDRANGSARPSAIQVSLADGASVFLNYSETKTDLYVGRGFGPLSLNDTSPVQLKSRLFSSGCSLTFAAITAKPSPEVLARMAAEKSDKQQLLDTKRILLETYDQLSEFKVAYEMLNGVADLILNDLSLSNSVVEKLKKFQTCKVTPTGENFDCALFLKIVGDSSDRLTLSEKFLVSKMNALLLQIDPDAPSSIKTYLSEDDVKNLASISEKSRELSDLDAKIETLSREIVELENQIKNIELKLGAL